MNKPESKYLDINSVRLHYLDWGNQGCQPMLLLHGFMGNAHFWDDFANNFNKDFYIIALDQRGHGESSWRKVTSYTIDDHFSDIVKLVDLLDIDDFILVGHSMGGRNAIFLCGMYA